ncbi:nuclear protein DGCR14 [Xylariomycetidae sp. FL2044]|nr:nuclear protein DGCR14 [Xylariomycetidae sp. FL2044]
MDSPSKESSALVRKRSDLDLMPPPPAPKRIKRPKKIVDEESYTEALSQIIARDFFPGLLESETQQEYLDALDSNDSAWISSAGRRLQQVMTPGRRRTTRRGTSLAPGAQTPTTFVGDTPVSTTGQSTTASVSDDKPDIDTNMSLGAFQSKYTSEDNESFYKLLDKQNLKKAEKYAWLWTGNNKVPSKMQLKQREVENRLLMEKGTLADDGFEKRDRLAIKDRDDRPAQCDTWKTLPNNGLMFKPEGIEDSGLELRIHRAEAESRAAPKAVDYQNTRMPPPASDLLAGDDDDDQSVMTSLSAVRDAIAGRRRAGSTTTGAGGETPRVNGYAFVDDEEPAPQPETAVPPLRINLGPGDATPNPFVIKEQGRREALHHRMVDRIAEAKRSSARAGMTGKVGGNSNTPVPRFPSSPRVGGSSGGLTPAAQRLWSKIGTGGGSSTPRTPFGGTDGPRRATPVGKGLKRGTK